MKLRKTLTSIVLAGTLALSGCSAKVKESRYDFNGNLGDEYVEFRYVDNLLIKSYNYLYVKREDGTIINYMDTGSDLKLDTVAINGKIYEKNDVIGDEVLKVAQQQYDDYLKRILEYKKQKAIDSIKKAVDSIK